MNAIPYISKAHAPITSESSFRFSLHESQSNYLIPEVSSSYPLVLFYSTLMVMIDYYQQYR